MEERIIHFDSTRFLFKVVINFEQNEVTFTCHDKFKFNSTATKVLYSLTQKGLEEHMLNELKAIKELHGDYRVISKSEYYKTLSSDIIQNVAHKY